MMDQFPDNLHISFLGCHHEGCLLKVLNQIDNRYLETVNLTVFLFLSSEQNTINFITEKAYVVQSIWSHNQHAASIKHSWSDISNQNFDSLHFMVLVLLSNAPLTRANLIM